MLNANAFLCILCDFDQGTAGLKSVTDLLKVLRGVCQQHCILFGFHLCE